MKRLQILTAVAVIGLLAGCASSEDKAADADAQMKQKRMEMADQYQECTTKANAYDAAVTAGTGNDMAPEDQVQMSTCDEIMKTLEALK